MPDKVWVLLEWCATETISISGVCVCVCVCVQSENIFVQKFNTARLIVKNQVENVTKAYLRYLAFEIGVAVRRR